MKIQKLIQNRLQKYQIRESIPVVLSSRIRLARNLAKFPFPNWAKDNQRKEILTICKNVIMDSTFFKSKGTEFQISNLSELEKQFLIESHLISPDLGKSKTGSAVLISKDQDISIMINEEDHLRIQVLKEGFCLPNLWKKLNSIDSTIENNLDFAFSNELGYLTSCLTNLGTGMRASILIHLPGLFISNQIDQIIRAVNQLGVAVRGTFGESSNAQGSFFQISNQQTLGESESTILKRLNSVLKTVIESELNARQKLLESKREKLFDKVGRAFGILKNSHTLSSSEAMNLLSIIRLGIDMNLFSENLRKKVDYLIEICQPAHLSLLISGINTKKQLEPFDCDIHRSVIVRKELEEIEQPNYN